MPQNGQGNRILGNKTWGQFFRNLKYGPRAIWRAWKEETSFRVEILSLPIIVGLLIVCHASWDDSRWVILGCTGTLAAEMRNTAHENDLRARYPCEAELKALDLVKHSRVQRAYDAAASPVTIWAIFTLIMIIAAVMRAS